MGESKMLTFATKKEFDTAGKYWNGRYEKYLCHVINKINELSKKHIVKRVLEIGCNGLQLVKESDTVDKNGTPDFKFDIGRQVWPFKDKEYDLAVSCQCWEHLEGNQQVAFMELMRTCKMAILTVPYMWPHGDDIHKGITMDKINLWYCNTKPNSTKMLGDKSKRLMSIFVFNGS